jgi:hypothetical protein
LLVINKKWVNLDEKIGEVEIDLRWDEGLDDKRRIRNVKTKKNGALARVLKLGLSRR